MVLSYVWISFFVITFVSALLISEQVSDIDLFAAAVYYIEDRMWFRMWVN